MTLNYNQENAHNTEPHHPKVSARGLASLLLAGMMLLAMSVAFTACQLEPTAQPEENDEVSGQTSSLTIDELCGADATGSECSSAKRFDARRGVWEAGSADEFDPGDEVLHDETLFEVEDDNVLMRQIEDVHRTDLDLASQAWDGADDHRPPGAEEIVYIVGDVGGHSRLRDVEDGERFAFQGRVYEAEVGDDSMQVHHSGETVNRVTNTFRDRADTVVDLRVRDIASGEEGTLTGTPDHPFYVGDRDEPVEMGELERGVKLRGEGGAVLHVESVDERAGDVEVFNFEVEGVHNYHVAAEGFGGVGALVGNKAAFRQVNISRVSEPGDNLIRRVETPGGRNIRVKSHHGYDRRHGSGDIRDTGLSMDEVDAGVATDLADRLDDGTSLPTPGTDGFSGPGKFETVIDGHEIGYEAVINPAESVPEITTYYPKP